MVRKVMCQCGRGLKQEPSKQCRRCYEEEKLKKSWKDIPLKRCLNDNCGKIIPRSVFRDRRHTFGKNYQKRKFCSVSCWSSYTQKLRFLKGYRPSGMFKTKNPRPSKDELIRLFNKLRQYKLMAKELGVCRNTITNWMGKKIFWTDPRTLYRGDKRSPRKVKKGAERKKYGSYKINDNRREYYKQYYLNNTKSDSAKIEKRRKRAMMYEREYRLKKKLHS